MKKIGSIVVYAFLTAVCGCDNRSCLPNVAQTRYDVSDLDKSQLVEVARSCGLTGTITDVQVQSYKGLDFCTLSVRVEGTPYYKGYFVTQTGGVWRGSESKSAELWIQSQKEQ